MVNEDFIRQMADGLIQKLIKTPTTIEVAQKAFVVFCEETTDLLRSKIIKALPNEEVIDTNAIGEKIKELSSCKVLILVAPSIDLAAKITNLQTDCPISAIVVKALFANKRVIAIATGPLAITETLRVGLRKAVEDLRCKLVDMGVEFTDITELAQIVDAPNKALEVVSTPGFFNNTSQNTKDAIDLYDSQKAITLAIVPQINYPISQHPSQQKLAAKDELSEFVEFLQTKPCTMEKGKPCDRCDICNTLGF